MIVSLRVALWLILARIKHLNKNNDQQTRNVASNEGFGERMWKQFIYGACANPAENQRKAIITIVCYNNPKHH